MTCGSGHKTEQRYCNNPKPSSDGRYCSGSNKRTLECSKPPCQSESPCMGRMFTFLFRTYRRVDVCMTVQVIWSMKSQAVYVRIKLAVRTCWLLAFFDMAYLAARICGNTKIALCTFKTTALYSLLAKVARRLHYDMENQYAPSPGAVCMQQQ